MTSPLAAPLLLPCGVTVPNRLAKAAMTEGLADPAGLPTAELERLYGVWADGGSGLLLSGNIQVDADHLERPGNVIVDEPWLDGDARLTAMQSWTRTAARSGNQFWAQISHAGRQTQKAVNPHPKAPSAVRVNLPGGQFGEPVALTTSEIADIIRRFADAAATCQRGGFTGVQVHGAHGYLLSQFLSPLSNQRTDDWGGPIEHRARMLREVVRAVRAAVGPAFPVAVKLNSADFQRGGFAFEESLQVASWLEADGVDLIEISGGTYEQPKLLGIEGLEAPEAQRGVTASTLAREAYFVDFARAMRTAFTRPLMVTGGFRSRSAMEAALDEGAADLIGLGRPLCYQPDGPARLLAGADRLPERERDLALLPRWARGLKSINMVRALDGFATQYWFYSQLYALGRMGAPAPDRTVFASLREVESAHKAWLKARRG